MNLKDILEAAGFAEDGTPLDPIEASINRRPPEERDRIRAAQAEFSAAKGLDEKFMSPASKSIMSDLAVAYTDMLIQFIGKLAFSLPKEATREDKKAVINLMVTKLMPVATISFIGKMTSHEESLKAFKQVLPLLDDPAAHKLAAEIQAADERQTGGKSMIDALVDTVEASHDR